MRGAESLEKAMGYVRKGPWETTAAAVPATVSGGRIVGRPGHCQDPPYSSLRFISLIAAGGLCFLFGSGRGPPHHHHHCNKKNLCLQAQVWFI